MVDNEEKSEKTKTKNRGSSFPSGASVSSASSTTSPPAHPAPVGATGTSSFARLQTVTAASMPGSPSSGSGRMEPSPRGMRPSSFGDLSPATPAQGSSSPVFGDLETSAPPSSADRALGSYDNLGHRRASSSPVFGDLRPAPPSSLADRVPGAPPRASSPVSDDLETSVPRFGSSEQPVSSWTNQPSEDLLFFAEEGSWSRVDDEVQKKGGRKRRRSTYGLNTTSAPAARLSDVSLLGFPASDEESDSEITLVPLRTSVISRDRSASSESAPNFGSSTVRASFSLNAVDNHQVELKRLPSYAFSSHVMDSGHSAAGGSAPPTPSATSARTVTGPPSSAPSLRKTSTVLSAEERLLGHVLSGKSSPTMATSISPHVYLDTSRPGSVQDNTPYFSMSSVLPDSFPRIGGEGGGKSSRGMATDGSDGDDVPRFGCEPSAEDRSHDDESIGDIPTFGGQDSGATFSAPSSRTPQVSLDQSSGKIFSQKSMGGFSGKPSSPNRQGTPMLRKKEESSYNEDAEHRTHQLQQGSQHTMDSLLEAASRQFMGDLNNSYPNGDDVEFRTNKTTGSYTFQSEPDQQQPRLQTVSPNLSQLLKSAGSPKSTVERRTQGEHERYTNVRSTHGSGATDADVDGGPNANSDRSSLLPEFGGGEAGESVTRIGGGAGEDVSMDTRIGGDPRIELVEEYLTFTDLDGMGTFGEMPLHGPASFPDRSAVGTTTLTSQVAPRRSSGYTGSITITDPVVSGHDQILDFEDFDDVNGLLTPSQVTAGVKSIDGDMGYNRISQQHMMQGHGVVRKNSVNQQYMSQFTGPQCIDDHFDDADCIYRCPAPRDGSPSYAIEGGGMHFQDFSLRMAHQDEEMTAATEISGPILETKKPIDRSSPWPLPLTGSFKAALMDMERELKSKSEELRTLKQSRVGSSIPEAALILAARQGWVPAEKVNADFERINKQMEAMAMRLERALEKCKKEHVPRQELLVQAPDNEKRPSSSSFKQRTKERASLPPKLPRRSPDAPSCASKSSRSLTRMSFTPTARSSSKDKVSSTISESHSHSHSSSHNTTRSSHKEPHKSNNGRTERDALQASLEEAVSTKTTGRRRPGSGGHTSSLPPKPTTDRRSLHLGSTLMNVEEEFPRASGKIEEKRGISGCGGTARTTYADADADRETYADMGDPTITRFRSSISTGKNEANREALGPISVQQHLALQREIVLLQRDVVGLKKALEIRDEEIRLLQKESLVKHSQQTQATSSAAASRVFTRQSIGRRSTDLGAGGQPRGGVRHASSQGALAKLPRRYTLFRRRSQILRPFVAGTGGRVLRYGKAKVPSTAVAKCVASSTLVLGVERNKKDKSNTTVPKAAAAPKAVPEKRRSMTRKP